MRISFIISAGSIDDVVFIDQVNLSDRGLEVRSPPPAPAAWPTTVGSIITDDESDVLPPPDNEDR